MNLEAEELRIPTIRSIQLLLEPILLRLQNIESRLKKTPPIDNSKKYYRNADLRNNFGISPNTIIKYRETGILPYTRLGDVYLYEVEAINSILEKNSVK
jgi:hypothetical protein